VVDYNKGSFPHRLVIEKILIAKIIRAKDKLAVQDIESNAAERKGRCFA
jgi:hypothetical protein